jgi:hypothetical protein
MLKVKMNQNVLSTLKFVGKTMYNGISITYQPCIWSRKRAISISLRNKVLAYGEFDGDGDVITFRLVSQDKYYAQLAARVIRMITE